MRDDAIKRTTKLILFQAQQDHATELVVRSCPGTGAAVRYKVAESWHDWKSPGPELAPAIIGEIGSRIGLGLRDPEWEPHLVQWSLDYYEARLDAAASLSDSARDRVHAGVVLGVYRYAVRAAPRARRFHWRMDAYGSGGDCGSSGRTRADRRGSDA